MAEIVGALGVPHNPFTALALARGDEAAGEARRLYGALASELRAMAPDTIMIVTTDHYNLFFELSVPIFSIGVAERAAGPCDYPQLPRVDVALDAALAREIQAGVVAQEFDVGASRELELDHTITAPLGAMLGEVEVPLVPLYVSGSMHPLPTARRCFALGRAVRRTIERSALTRRVAIVASGAFSFEVGGPRMSEDSHVGVPDPAWAVHVTELLAAGEFARVVTEATPEQLDAAGNASGELLDWLVMLGTFDARAPVFIEAQPQEGHAFAAWRLAQ
jgi:aromatic ring-opening dioxygenase catalytic subunit (LigB family)